MKRKTREQRAASSRLGAAQMRYDAIQIRLDGDVAEAWFGLEAVRKAIRIVEQRQLNPARLLVETAQSGFAAGAADLATSLEAERRLRAIELEILKLKVEEQARYAELERLADSLLTRRHIVILLGFVVVAASLAWLVAGHFKWVTPSETPGEAGLNISGKAPAATGPIIYYRDPDGRPAYSLTPKKTSAGKDYLPVRASEDVSFEDKPPPAAVASGERRVRYPPPMGLPDTSPVPKKDAMGMDYIPVYEDEAENGTTITISPGKLQKTGVRSEPVERRTLNVPVRATGRIEFDPRRISIVSIHRRLGIRSGSLRRAITFARARR